MFRRMESDELKRRMQVAKAHARIRSQDELVRRIKSNGAIWGLGRATLDKIENGRLVPDTDQLRVIAAACEVPDSYLIDPSYDPMEAAWEQELDEDDHGPGPGRPPSPRLNPKQGPQNNPANRRREAGS